MELSFDIVLDQALEFLGLVKLKPMFLESNRLNMI